MKFAEALRHSKTFTKYKGTLWMLSSYNPSIFTVFLQSVLLERGVARHQDVPRVRSFEFDVLLRAIQGTSTADERYAPAVMSLVWEDFMPSLGWRSRQVAVGSTDNLSFEPSNHIREMIIDWADKRYQAGGLSIVMLPPDSWIPPHGAFPAPLVHPLQAQMGLWKNQLVLDLQTRGVLVIDLGQPAIELRSLLEGGCPWTLDAARATAQTVAEMLQPSHEHVKAVIVDLDQTLWPGIIEDGSAVQMAKEERMTLRLYHALAKLLFVFKCRGIFLACCSKNDLKTVQSLFPELSKVLAFSDFNAASISWGRKSEGIQSICEQLNILPKNVLFIDDNSAELLEVQNVFPEIMTLQTPDAAPGWPDFLKTLQQMCFRPVTLEEDRLRVAGTRLPIQNVKGKSPAGGSKGSTAYLKSLALTAAVKQNQWWEPRTIDLLNKTNQFTLNGKRVTLPQMNQLANRPGAWCLTLALNDQQGSFGTVAAMFGQTIKSTLTVEALAVSCRAFDRHMEFAFLKALLQLHPVRCIVFRCKDTGKNKHARQFLRALNIPWGAKTAGKTAPLQRVLQSKVSEAGISLNIQ